MPRAFAVACMTRLCPDIVILSKYDELQVSDIEIGRLRLRLFEFRKMTEISGADQAQAKPAAGRWYRKGSEESFVL